MSEENCIEITVSEKSKSVKKLVVAMELFDKTNGYEHSGIIFVDNSLFSVIKKNPNHVFFIKINYPQKKIGDFLPAFNMTITSISVVFTGFTYGGWVLTDSKYECVVEGIALLTSLNHKKDQ